MAAKNTKVHLGSCVFCWSDQNCFDICMKFPVIQFSGKCQFKFCVIKVFKLTTVFEILQKKLRNTDGIFKLWFYSVKGMLLEVWNVSMTPIIHLQWWFLVKQYNEWISLCCTLAKNTLNMFTQESRSIHPHRLTHCTLNSSAVAFSITTQSYELFHWLMLMLIFFNLKTFLTIKAGLRSDRRIHIWMKIPKWH